MSTNHTPTPWKFQDEPESETNYSVHFGGECIFYDSVYSATAPDKINAKFIVKAVNMHEELVAALEEKKGIEERAKLLETHLETCLVEILKTHWTLYKMSLKLGQRDQEAEENHRNFIEWMKSVDKTTKTEEEFKNLWAGDRRYIGPAKCA